MTQVAPRFPTQNPAAGLIERLQRTDSRPSRALARLLATCTPVRPCQSGACLQCGRDLQRAASNLVVEAIRVPAEKLRHRASFITLIPALGCVAPGTLTSDLLRQVRSEVAEAATAAALGPTVFGMEISFNVDLEGRTPTHWMPHGHGTSLDWLSERQRDALSARLPANDLVKRPVNIVELDGRPNGPDYTFKPERFQRESYIKQPKPHSGRAPYRDTRRHPLRVEQSVELALIEHEVGLRARVLTHGIAADVVERHLGGFNWARDGP